MPRELKRWGTGRKNAWASKKKDKMTKAFNAEESVVSQSAKNTLSQQSAESSHLDISLEVEPGDACVERLPYISLPRKKH